VLFSARSFSNFRARRARLRRGLRVADCAEREIHPSRGAKRVTLPGDRSMRANDADRGDEIQVESTSRRFHSFSLSLSLSTRAEVGRPLVGEGATKASERHPSVPVLRCGPVATPARLGIQLAGTRDSRGARSPFPPTGSNGPPKAPARPPAHPLARSLANHSPCRSPPRLSKRAPRACVPRVSRDMSREKFRHRLLARRPRLFPRSHAIVAFTWSRRRLNWT